MKSASAKKLISFFISACMALPVTGTGAPAFRMKGGIITAEAAYPHDDDLVLRYDTMAGFNSIDNAFNNDESFYRALPLGNGRIGAMAYGNYPDELFDINECTVWSAGPGNNNRQGASKRLAEVQQLLSDRKYTDADAIVGNEMIAGGEAKYQKVGALKLSFGHEKVSDYSRELDMNDAVARSSYTFGGKRFTRETFVSHPDQVMVTRITCDSPSSVSLTAGYEGVLNGTVTADGNDTIVANGHGDEDLWTRGAVYFSTRSRFIPEGGRVSAGNGKVTVSDADSLLIITSVRTNFVDYKTCNGDEKGDAKADIERTSDMSYETLYENHVRDYQELFKRVDVELGGDSAAARTMTAPQRIASFGSSDDPKMVKTLFQYGRYLMISASRDAQPMNLQGIWNKYSAPAWGSKATTNINYEMNYWPAFTTNLAECFTPFAEKSKGLAEAGNETARVHYGISEGWVLHHNTDLWNRTGPIDGTWGQWPVGGAWVSNMLYDAYRFNRSEEYLADIYPVIKGSAQFLNSLMTTADINGQEYMVISPSTSPELNLPPYANTYIAHSVTMDNGIARELFKDVAEASEILGCDTELRNDLNAKLSLIRPETIGKWGQIQEWAEDWDNKNEKHRHISHMYALYPGFEITPEDNPTTANAAAVSLNARGDDGTGWSEAWKLNCWARLEDGEHAYKLIKLLITPVNRNGRLYDNLWDAHPPFQIDGNFGFTSGVAEMLLQSQNDVITLLPAIPKQWSEGHANGLCARGNFEVREMSWKNGQLEKAVILSKSGGTCTVRYGGAEVSFDTEKGGEYTLGPELLPEEAGGELKNLASGKEATASGSGSGESAAMAVDGDKNTKWCHDDGIGGEWLQVDLGEVCDIQRWSASFAGINENIRFNPRDFVLRGSTDGESWTDISRVYGNTKSSCGRSVSKVSARYVRLEMLTSTQDNSGGARVYELEIWGSDGKPPVPKTAFKTYGGNAYNFMRGEIRKDDSGSTAIGYITDGSYIVFRNLDFESGAEGFRAKTASAADGGTIEIRIGSANGELIGKCPVGGTDGWDEYTETSCRTSQCEGVNDVYLVFRGGDGYLFNVSDFGFYGIAGDINCDRQVDVFDMIRMRKALLNSSGLSGLALSNSDMNNDSQTNTADAVSLQKYLLGIK
ncbi:glycosyl hydrolase family 95 catalytic domain-containing protein [Ruminococcus flavefaciens]|uniref:glycosyl hydrolase family 95 catalytic domain-containing protein n=1 Tax=Ruminococcus flavefaciens TaxID=1265 RepID=UPI0002FE964E|nr:glycoside hydrolase N-terminal domain-containing protein [Ruminococcus flavefaciens]